MLTNQPITLAAALAGKTVQVELLADREYKDDCQGNTGIVWRGKGDVQRYPASLWPKLAAHPTVWGLVGEDAEDAPSLSPEQLAKNAQLAEADRVRLAAEEAAGRKTDLVHIEPDRDAGTASIEAAYDYKILTEERQNEMTVEELHKLAADLKYSSDANPIHPRLGETKMRPLFARITAARLAEQLARESGTFNAESLNPSIANDPSLRGTGTPEDNAKANATGNVPEQTTVNQANLPTETKGAKGKASKHGASKVRPPVQPGKRGGATEE